MAGERRFQPLAELLRPRPLPFLLMLDGVEDPFNFGQAVRAAYAAGITGLLVRPRNWMSSAGVVARASAGASELTPSALIESVPAAYQACTGAGINVLVLTDKGDRSLFDADLTVPLLLIVGGEQRGVTRSFRALSHTDLSIPYGRADSYALGTASAAAVATFEVLRQRRRSSIT